MFEPVLESYTTVHNSDFEVNMKASELKNSWEPTHNSVEEHTEGERHMKVGMNRLEQNK
jgi:hypothetical protein